MATGEKEVSGRERPIGCTQAWALANPGSRALSQRAGRVLPGGVTHEIRRAVPFPLAVARAQGARKWDLDGHEIVCYVMGHGALLLGHSHPEVVAAVQQQAPLALHPGACHELESEWAEAVVDLVPSAELVRFTASGTEASLLALRLARAATGRERVVKLAGHFHGWHDQVSFGTDARSWGRTWPGVPGVLGQVVTVVPADERALAEALADRDVAAVILEPSGAAWGTVPLLPGLLAAARTLTSATGTVLVFDEVVSGFRWSPGECRPWPGSHRTSRCSARSWLGACRAAQLPDGRTCLGSCRSALATRAGSSIPGPVSRPPTGSAVDLAITGGAGRLRAGLPARHRLERLARPRRLRARV